MRDPAQEGFFLPVGLRGFSIGDDGRACVAPAEAFNYPDAFDAHEIRVKNAGTGQTVDEERFGLLYIKPVDNTILFRVKTGADALGKIRMRRQNQNCLHNLTGKNGFRSIIINGSSCSAGTVKKSN